MRVINAICTKGPIAPRSIRKAWNKFACSTLEPAHGRNIFGWQLNQNFQSEIFVAYQAWVASEFGGLGNIASLSRPSTFRRTKSITRSRTLPMSRNVAEWSWMQIFKSMNDRFPTVAILFTATRFAGFAVVELVGAGFCLGGCWHVSRRRSDG